MSEISKNVQEGRLKWYSNVTRIEEEYNVDKTVMVTRVLGKRKKGRR